MSLGKRAIKRIEGRNRCGHPYCSECKTRRGNNLGNRRNRRAIKRLLHLVRGDHDS